MKGQLKKLTHDKKFVDRPDGETLARWKLAPWKIFLILVTAMILLLVLYSFVATPEPQNFLGNILFYAIVIVGATIIIWIIGNIAYKGRILLAGFFLAFILILTFYWGLGTLLSYFNILDFHMGGWSLWIMITVLAGLGAKRIDGNLDRNDVFYGLLVFIICMGANIPIANDTGFLNNLDNFIFSLIGWTSSITQSLGLISWHLF